MTEENKKHAIALEASRGDERLGDAEALLKGGRIGSVIGLAYYAAFHYARALILMEGLEAKTHGGVVHLVNLHFTRTARLSPELADVLASLQDRRERSEYDSATVFTPAMASRAVEQARQFTEAARAILTTAGYLQA